MYSGTGQQVGCWAVDVFSKEDLASYWFVAFRSVFLLLRPVPMCFAAFRRVLTCSATALTCCDTFRRISTHSFQIPRTLPMSAWSTVTRLAFSEPFFAKVALFRNLATLAWSLLGGERKQFVSEEASTEVMNFWVLRFHVSSQSLPSFWASQKCFFVPLFSSKAFPLTWPV